MGCCCSKEEIEEDEAGERTPLLSEKHISKENGLKEPTTTQYVPVQIETPEIQIPDEDDTKADDPPIAPATEDPPVTESVTEYVPVKETIREDATEDHPATDPVNEDAQDDGLEPPPKDTTPSRVAIKSVHIERYDEQMQATLTRFHGLLDRFQQLQNTGEELRQMYPEYNKTHTMDGCFYHVRNILSDKNESVVVQTDDPTSLWITYKVESTHHSLLPALNTFNKASRLVKDITYEVPQLGVAVDEVIVAEVDIRKQITDNDRFLVYNIIQFNRIKAMLEKIAHETKYISTEMQGALGEIKCETKPADVSQGAESVVSPQPEEDHIVEHSPPTATFETAASQKGAAEEVNAIPVTDNIVPDATVETKSQESTDAPLDASVDEEHTYSPAIIRTPPSPMDTEDSPTNAPLDEQSTSPAVELQMEVVDEAAPSETADQLQSDVLVPDPTDDTNDTTEHIIDAHEGNIPQVDVGEVTFENEDLALSTEETITEEPTSPSPLTDAESFVTAESGTPVAASGNESELVESLKDSQILEPVDIGIHHDDDHVESNLPPSEQIVDDGSAGAGLSENGEAVTGTSDTNQDNGETRNTK